ncbi:hypothetical protein MOV65_08655 [Neorhizobium sp. SHOUNA12B]|nr:hypothetical protein [Neorhizobium sp. SHOUNA12B]
MRTPTTSDVLEEARSDLLATAVDWFERDPHVLGIFLARSIAAESADAYSDIDLPIVIEPGRTFPLCGEARGNSKAMAGFSLQRMAPGHSALRVAFSAVREDRDILP